MLDNNINLTGGKLFYFLVSVFSLYIIVHSLVAAWLLIDGLTSNFSSIHYLWGVKNEVGFDDSLALLFFTIIGSVLGGAVLNIISFHKYFSIDNSFDIKHFWGFFFTPILSIIVGILIFSLVQGGLLILNGSSPEGTLSTNSALGFTAIGSIAGYNWDVFIKKLQDMSKILNSQNDPK